MSKSRMKNGESMTGNETVKDVAEALTDYAMLVEKGELSPLPRDFREYAKRFTEAAERDLAKAVGNNSMWCTVKSCPIRERFYPNHDETMERLRKCEEIAKEMEATARESVSGEIPSVYVAGWATSIKMNTRLQPQFAEEERKRNVICGRGWFYKPHKGGLVESLKEMQKFDNIDDMFDFIVKDWSAFKVIDKSRLFVCAEENYDGRIGAYLHYVGYCDADGEEGVPQCIGHAFCKYDENVLNAALAGKIDFYANWGKDKEQAK